MKKDNPIMKKIIAGLFMTLIVAYFLSSALRTLNEYTNFQKNVLDFKGTLDFIFNTNSQNQMVVLLLSAVFFGFMISKMGGKKGYKDASDHGVHGTSRWGKFEELLKGNAIAKKNKFNPRDPIKTFEIEKGIIVAKKPKSRELLIIPKDTTIDNRNVLVVGSSGSGKGQSFVFPNLLNNTEETMIVIDPKGELYEATHQIKRDQGYDVFQIDFINFKSNRYNPLDYVMDDQDALEIARTIGKNSAKDQKDDFFASEGINLLAGLIIYCKSKNPKANIPDDVLGEFYKISEDEEYLVRLCKQIGEHHPAYKRLKSASVSEGKTRASILATFAQQTSIFTFNKIAKMTETSDFNFHDFQKKKSILYVKIRMDENPFTALTATFFDQLISVFYKIADENNSVLPIPSIFLLDEFANVGRIEKYGRVLATCRGLGMSMNTVIQDIAQLEALYGKEQARTIINNHDIQLFLRTKDVETAKYFSNLAGDTTVKMSTSSSSQTGGIFTANSSASTSKQEQYVKRPLITEGELLTVDKNECYVFISGYYPLKMEKSFQYEIYGDFLFKGKGQPNYHAYREKYLKFLGVEPQEEIVTDHSETENPVTNDRNYQEEIASTIEFTQNEAVERKMHDKEQESVIEIENVNTVEETETNKFYRLAHEFLSEQNILKDIENASLVQNKEPYEQSQDNIMNDAFLENELFEHNDLQELSDIVAMINSENDCLKEAETSLKEIEMNQKIMENLDEIIAVLNESSNEILNDIEDDMEIFENVN
jgi:type IV secretion system protein VirD4